MINKDDFDGNIKFGGKEFHKSTARDKLIESIVEGKEGQLFFDCKENILTPKDKYFEDIATCILCGSNQLLPLVERNGLKVSRCKECGLGMQNPRFRAQHVSKIYEDTYCMDDTYSSSNAIELDEIKFKYGIQESRKINNNIASVLDVGCGPGLSLYAYKQAGIQNIAGLDPGKYSKDLSGGITIVKDDFGEISSNFRNISLITMWDVLEHIHDIKCILADVWNSLESDGLLLIMVPNLLSLATRLIRSASPTFCIDHLNYFTENSLELALTQSNFKVVSKETVISEIDNCRNYLEFSGPYDSVPKNEQAFDWLTSDYIHENMLGSRLLFIAKKVNR